MNHAKLVRNGLVSLCAICLLFAGGGGLRASDVGYLESPWDFGATPTGVFFAPVNFSLRIGAWLPQTRTNAKTGMAGDSRVNFSNLHVDPNSAIPELDASVTLFGNRFRLGYWDSTQDGRTTLSNAITFNGQTFPAASDVKSNVDLSVVKAGYEYMFVDGEWLRLGAGFGADFISSSEQIKLSSGAAKAKRSDSQAILFLSGEVALKFSWLELFANVDALSYGSAAMFDGRAGLAISLDLPPLAPVFSAGGGVDWRVWDAKLDTSKINEEWTQQGLEIFVFVRF